MLGRTARLHEERSMSPKGDYGLSIWVKLSGSAMSFRLDGVIYRLGLVLRLVVCEKTTNVVQGR